MSFFRFECIFLNSGVPLSDFWNVYKSRRVDLISSWEPILLKVWIIWPLLLYFSFKSFMDRNSSSFVRFQWILHDSGVLFSESWNFYKLKREDLISGENQSCRKSESFVPPFCILIFKVLRTELLCHWLDFNAFCWIQEYLSQTIESFTN